MIKQVIIFAFCIVCIFIPGCGEKMKSPAEQVTVDNMFTVLVQENGILTTPDSDIYQTMRESFRNLCRDANIPLNIPFGKILFDSKCFDDISCHIESVEVSGTQLHEVEFTAIRKEPAVTMVFTFILAGSSRGKLEVGQASSTVTRDGRKTSLDVQKIIEFIEALVLPEQSSLLKKMGLNRN